MRALVLLAVLAVTTKVVVFKLERICAITGLVYVKTVSGLRMSGKNFSKPTPYYNYSKEEN